MIDQFFQKLAEQIYGVMLPGLKQVIENLLTNNIFETMSAEELQISCIKIALEAVALAIVIKICSKPKKSNRKAKRNQAKTENTFKPQKWSTEGWIWNEEEGLWEPPDYIIKESNERWRYDKSKGIWIDLNKEQ